MPQLVTDVRKLPNFRELPETAVPIGAHLSVPIVLPDGAIYGTACCFSAAPNDAVSKRDLKRLQMAADMMARTAPTSNLSASGNDKQLSMSTIRSAMPLRDRSAPSVEAVFGSGFFVIGSRAWALKSALEHRAVDVPMSAPASVPA